MRLEGATPKTRRIQRTKPKKPVPLKLVDGATSPAFPGNGRLAVIPASDLVSKRTRYLWDQRVPVRAVTLMAGEEGIGKSLIEIDTIAQLTRGTLDGEYLDKPQSVYLLTPEDDPESVVRPRLEAAGADLDRVYIVGAHIASEDESDKDGGMSLCIPRDLALLKDGMDKHGVSVMFADALADLLPERIDSHNYTDVSKVLHPLNSWAQDNNFTVMALWHINKTVSSDSAVKMMGSRAFRTAVRSVLMVARDPDLNEGEQGGIVVLDKANAGTLDVPALRYRIDSHNYTVDELDQETGLSREVEASCGLLRWAGEVEGDGRALLRESMGMVNIAGSPRAWLKDWLELHGEMLRKDVIRDAKAAGFSEPQMKRAAQSIRVSYRNVSVERKGKPPFRETMWSLSQNAVSPDAPNRADRAD